LKSKFVWRCASLIFILRFKYGCTIYFIDQSIVKFTYLYDLFHKVCETIYNQVTKIHKNDVQS
jgi:hypothetical protein